MLTLALTHFNRVAMLLEAIAHVHADPRIGEIVVVDDASHEAAWDRLVAFFDGYSKVKLFRNDRNLDCYRNKAEAVWRSSGDWVVLFDSDNIMHTDYLDRLHEVAPWDETTAYLPVFAEPHFDYRAYEGVVVDRSNVAGYMDDVTFRTALNTANHLCQRKRYLDCFDPDTDPHTADSIYMNYRWLAAGNRLHFVPGLRYLHRVHDGSHYRQNHQKTGSFYDQVVEALRSLR